VNTNKSAFLAVKNSQITDQNGREIILRGIGLGGWMNMENFVTGFPANEESFREKMLSVLGPSKYAYFFERYLDYFFTEDDILFIKSLGLNTVRLPVNYRHFEDDLYPVRNQGEWV
jgi:endoglucanase